MKRALKQLLALVGIVSPLLTTCFLGPEGEEEWVVARVEYSVQHRSLEIIIANVDNIDSYDYVVDEAGEKSFDFRTAFEFSDGQSRIHDHASLHEHSIMFYGIDPPLDHTSEGISLVFDPDVTFYKADITEWTDLIAVCHFKDQTVPVTFIDIE